ncbi:nucleotidyltransferase domain-containing protein [Yoonia sp.]|uniref:nucleotidyltransferase domain-containing protein n=1 Tax=Yoonia sp. TaxID=2212373 RepID=UPI00390C7F07
MEMQAASVLRFWEMARKVGLNICIDGGWAVDALLGRQTRQHGDLDIALPVSQVASLRTLLGPQGFFEVARPDSSEHNFVLRTPEGETIDVHSYELNPDGSNRAGVPYCADHLCGEGVISGAWVRCVPPDWLVRFHTGYDVDEEDWHDVRLLCAKFNIAIPDNFHQFADAAPND